MNPAEAARAARVLARAAEIADDIAAGLRTRALTAAAVRGSIDLNGRAAEVERVAAAIRAVTLDGVLSSDGTLRDAVATNTATAECDALGLQIEAMRAHLDRLRSTVRSVGEERDRLADALHLDRTRMAKALANIVSAAKAHMWILDGRGSYEWDDDRYRKEAGVALHNVVDLAEAALHASGNLAQMTLKDVPLTPPNALETAQRERDEALRKTPTEVREAVTSIADLLSCMKFEHQPDCEVSPSDPEDTCSCGVHHAHEAFTIAKRLVETLKDEG